MAVCCANRAAFVPANAGTVSFCAFSEESFMNTVVTAGAMVMVSAFVLLCLRGHIVSIVILLALLILVDTIAYRRGF